jgi:hypothetical protein
VHLALLLGNLAISGYFLYLAYASQIRGVFILYLLASIISALPMPFLLYQVFALARAKYVISRNGITIQWGLRTEDIPISDVEWIRIPQDFVNPITPPAFRLPGAILASSMDRDIGLIEYIAADRKRLVLVATPAKVFALSPGNPYAFIDDFHHSAELGSFTTIQKQSSKPDLIFTLLVRDKIARNLLLASLAISLVMLVAVSFIIPSLETVPLGLEAIGEIQEVSPSERLILLPLLSLLVFFIDLGYGAYLYRKEGFKNAAYIVFFSSLFLPLSFAILLVFILGFR